MASLTAHIGQTTNRLYPRFVHRGGPELAQAAATGSLADLAGRQYCTVVSFRRSGEPVATPVWFGIADGRLYFRSLAGTAKLRRIEHTPDVLVAPCSRRGKPLGAPFSGRARVL